MMRGNVCEIETIGSSVENIWNRLFSGDISFVSEASRQLCYVAETNIMLAMLLAFCLPFLEAFIPALPYTAFVFFNVNLIGGVLGFILSLLGTVTGSFLLFMFVRYFLQTRVLAFLQKRNHVTFYNRIAEGLEKHGVLYIFILYGVLGLVLPSSLCTLSIALTSFSKRKFLIGLVMGKTLVTGVLVLFGKSIVEVLSNPLLLVGVVVAGIAIYYGTKYVTKRFDFHI